ncbi:gamma-glutamylcyclotransferase [Parvibaculum sp.]|jgi:cation transport protein ChaC|uniref:gamma-glutamylcyclotransferase n=1 Tax=Parvibaculum sp. TaxID=2024848 RepID=UPI000C4BEBE4|nr:gamma-glutamylcyclotransferase [Parvibaculum sp.]HAC58511.1 gamma-glutamylcyclotransferase [Rhodobiaceae bacterium]MAU60897.1 gamma-glutamylcyclotransferase [Parvibaculum sp.]MBO6668705.1 gamma-glutamylcyclotransferase [Parvibaculum sp.]MBO6691263.1 gamma-glutamylcyclotransferase [Parvibaculum sp.]MBO6714382.1 gamma-glutamylcyclotransferase [Parvibaculum sp.]|tara:strand:+ start:5017 stop:5550 length:534 start_codon:yes stop_codon:yes gene_type:complete
MQDLWVFGYGSLMWRPGFEFEERRPALLRGYHRAFCVYSHVHRGTPEKPGLVFGLDAGGSCRGVAFRVDAARAEDVKRYLQAREQVTLVYRDVVKPVELVDEGRRVEALCFVVDRAHEQYAGRIDFDEQVRLIAEGEGRSGKNPDYLESTVRHLDEAGLADEGLTRLWQAVERRLRR